MYAPARAAEGDAVSVLDHPAQPDAPRPHPVGVVHSETQRPVEFGGDRLVDLFTAAAGWLATFEAERGTPPDVLAVTTDLCEDGGTIYRLTLLCAESQFEGRDDVRAS
jgi:hypothetical protein